MKIAVAYDSGRIWQHFGRTESFKFYEVSDGIITSSKVVSTGDASHHALAGFLNDHNMDVVICGGVGAPMIQMLSGFGIKTYPGVEGDADQAVQSLLEGTLTVNNDAVHEGCHQHH